MDREEKLSERFEAERPRLRAVAYRMLGSLSESDDAVQEAWIRLERNGTEGIANLPAWLTTVVSRICLDALRSRQSKREVELDEFRLPDPVVSREDIADPENEALLADTVGIGMLVVLESLPPAERLAFVLHDVFGVPFAEIGEAVGRSPDAARQLASRARRKVRGGRPGEIDRARQREVVDAFHAAARDGEFEALIGLLDPDVVLRADIGDSAARRLVRGAEAVASQAYAFRDLARFANPVLVNGAPGSLVAPGGRPFSIMSFAISPDGLITEIDILADRNRLGSLPLPRLR